ncbi:uncharacterized protein ARMOST_11900 [Armillaria ostoyae]|uniref:Uncharacterized protein n=1 Tax=Armillaria ostoyae TaxID=47428 RepID=A0A284RIE3_ARMOS|nr:uncharacterized protein ARMOST_11900 [Armillaria ostoyae]
MVQLGGHLFSVRPAIYDGNPVPVIFIEEKNSNPSRYHIPTVTTPMTVSFGASLFVDAGSCRLFVPRFLRSLDLHCRNILSKTISLSNNTAFAIPPRYTAAHIGLVQLFQIRCLTSQANIDESYDDMDDDVISPNDM